ncbi:MAG: hypothetical protein H6Q33_3797 [Deltaproteobacteria bacterium]|nr:hypothetical protein [Deltaproteobacteria bacterium]
MPWPRGGGLRVWIAPRNIAPGQQWPAAIIDGIEGSRALVLIFSSHANQSDQVARELERAAAKRVPILSFRIEHVDPAGSLEYFIGVVQWIDATTAPLSAPLTELVEAIRALSTPRRVERATKGRFRTALDLFQERLRVRRAVTVAAAAVATGVSVLAVMSTLDFFALDARVQGLTLWLTRPWVATAPSPDLVLEGRGL